MFRDSPEHICVYVTWSCDSLTSTTFTVVGAKGHLSDTPGGNVVDYENVSLADLDNYYFTPEGNAPTPPTILYLQGVAKQGTTISSIRRH